MIFGFSLYTISLLAILVVYFRIELKNLASENHQRVVKYVVANIEYGYYYYYYYYYYFKSTIYYTECGSRVW